MHQNLLHRFLQLDLKHVEQVRGSNIVQVGIDLSEFYVSVEWDILAVPATRYLMANNYSNLAVKCRQHVVIVIPTRNLMHLFRPV